MKNQKAAIFLPVALVMFALFMVGCSTSPKKSNTIPITTSSSQARAEFIKGRNLVNSLRTQEATPYFNNAISEDSNFAMAYYMRAQNQTTAAAFFKDLNKAVSLANNVSDGERLMILALQARVEQNPTQVKADYDSLVSLYPEDPQALLLLGNYYLGQQDNMNATSELEKAIKADSTYSPAYNLLGYAYLRDGKYADAEKAFKKYTELIPDEPNPYDSYAELLMKEGKYTQSIENYQKALSKDPNFTSSHIGIAADYIYQGQYEDARDELQRMFSNSAKQNDKMTALNGIALTYIDQWKPEDALKEVDKIIDMNKESNNQLGVANNMFTKGDIYFEMGKYSDAMKNYAGAKNIITSSSVPQAIKNNAERGLLFDESRIAAMKRDFKTADADAQKVMQEVTAMNNQNQIKGAHQLMGLIDIQKRKADDALSELSQANQQDPYTNYLMAKAYLLKHDRAKAKTSCEAVMNCNIRPTTNSSFARAKARELLKRL